MRNVLLTFAVASITVALTAAPSNGSIHRVRRGDTGASIARANGLTLAQLSAMNPKVRLSKLRIGLVLQVGRTPSHRANRTSVEAQVSPLPATPMLRDAGI